MRHIIHHTLYIIAFMLCLIGCKSNKPAAYRGFPQAYVLAYEEQYGRAYDSVPHCVVALDLYSEGLELDTEHRMKGTGYNLYLSDIFVPDRTGADSLRLVPGTYRSSNSAEPFTFLPGQDYEGTPHGMYVLYVEEGKLQTIQVLDSGTMVYAGDSLLFTLYYCDSNGTNTTYTTRFKGTLIPWLKQ